MTDIEKLKKFARTIIQDSFNGGDVCGGEIQELGVSLGLLTKTCYDPKIHGTPDYDAMPGDDWYVFSDLIKE
jgi:hypothetical protein